jgi:hypothetical protein
MMLKRATAATTGPLVLAILAAAISAPAAGAEYCVSCSGPDATYRCAVEGSLAGAAADSREQLACVKELAQSLGHESCSVSRRTPDLCPGELKVVAAPLRETPLPIGEPAPEANLPPTPAADESSEPKTPKTVEELAKQTVQSSKEGLQKAGQAVSGTAKTAGEQIGKASSAVGNAAKKTWNCLISLFSDC